MILNILLLIDFVMLGVVIAGYVTSSLKERRYLNREAGRSLELQQKVYQAQVLKEIAERIGYNLDTDKIVEIIMSSLGNLLKYDTVSYLGMTKDGPLTFRCRVENTVNHYFLSQVKEKLLAAREAVVDGNATGVAPRLEEQVTGSILDDDLDVSVKSYFNLPVAISGELVGFINVASSEPGGYGERQAAILYTVLSQAGTAVTKLKDLLESERGKLSAAIYSLADGFVTVDLGYRLMVSNPAASEVLGLPKDRPLTMFDVVDALGGKVDLRTKIDQALKLDRPVKVSDLLVKDRFLELTVTPVKDARGEKIAASVVFHDITTEKSLEKLRQEFTAMMVHELRAPLTAIRWTAESLLKPRGDGRGPAGQERDSLSGIEQSAAGMLDLVNDLLDVAKIEAGKFELNVQEYDLVEIIKGELEKNRAQAETKHLELTLVSPARLRLSCDRVRIMQVLDNLLSNAIKYTDSGQVQVGVTEEPGKKQVVVAIKDSGIGIAPEDLSALFSKFKQLKRDDRSRKGTGLGLVVSKGIVESHGGRIWAESSGENLGSTFYFSLPLSRKTSGPG